MGEADRAPGQAVLLGWVGLGLENTESVWTGQIKMSLPKHVGVEKLCWNAVI